MAASENREGQVGGWVGSRSISAHLLLTCCSQYHQPDQRFSSREYEVLFVPLSCRSQAYALIYELGGLSMSSSNYIDKMS